METGDGFEAHAGRPLLYRGGRLGRGGRLVMLCLLKVLFCNVMWLMSNDELRES